MPYMTLKEIAQRLGLQESTARFYRDRFPEFVQAVGEGRSRRYKPEMEAVLRCVAEGYARGANAEEIKEDLRGLFPMSVPSAELPQRRSAAAQQEWAEPLILAINRLAEEQAETNRLLRALLALPAGQTPAEIRAEEPKNSTKEQSPQQNTAEQKDELQEQPARRPWWKFWK